jgi:hypothetical protein
MTGLTVDVAVFHQPQPGTTSTSTPTWRTTSRPSGGLFTEHLATDGRRVVPSDDPWGARADRSEPVRDVSWALPMVGSGPRQRPSTWTGPGSTWSWTESHGGPTCRWWDATTFAMRWRRRGVVRAGRRTVGHRRRARSGATPVRSPGARLGAHRRPVFVDFAHTPDGLHTVLESLASITDRRLVVVFGAGGDRDRGKRATMGRAGGPMGGGAHRHLGQPEVGGPGGHRHCGRRRGSRGRRGAGGDPGPTSGHRPGTGVGDRRRGGRGRREGPRGHPDDRRPGAALLRPAGHPRTSPGRGAHAADGCRSRRHHGRRVPGAGEARLRGAEVDSRRVASGDLFVALPGPAWTATTTSPRPSNTVPQRWSAQDSRRRRYRRGKRSSWCPNLWPRTTGWPRRVRRRRNWDRRRALRLGGQDHDQGLPGRGGGPAPAYRIQQRQ